MKFSKVRKNLEFTHTYDLSLSQPLRLQMHTKPNLCSLCVFALTVQWHVNGGQYSDNL